MKNKHPGGSFQYRKRVAAHPRHSWAPYALIGAGALLMIVFLVISFSQAGAQTVTPPRVGAPLSNFTLVDVQGNHVKLADHKGKVILVNAWATWCPPCRAEMPDLNAYYQAHQKDGFVVLAVNAGDSQSAAASFAQGTGLAFPVLLDPDLRLLDGLGIRSFPTSIVVGRDGRVKTIHVGMFDPQTLDAEVTPLLAQ